MKLKLFEQLSEESSNIKYTKILPVVPELFHADRRKAGHDEPNSRFKQFSEGA
jgi:hypothetical protein